MSTPRSVQRVKASEFHHGRLRQLHLQRHRGLCQHFDWSGRVGIVCVWRSEPHAFDGFCVARCTTSPGEKPQNQRRKESRTV